MALHHCTLYELVLFVSKEENTHAVANHQNISVIFYLFIPAINLLLNFCNFLICYGMSAGLNVVSFMCLCCHFGQDSLEEETVHLNETILVQ